MIGLGDRQGVGGRRRGEGGIGQVNTDPAQESGGTETKNVKSMRREYVIAIMNNSQN